MVPQVTGDELMKVTKTEAQAWFGLRQLLFNQRVMQSYDWNEFRCEQISKCLGLLNDVLLDQLTPLVQLQKYLATMSIQRPNGGGAGDSKKTSFLLEEIPEVQENYIKQIEDFGEESLIELQNKLFFSSDVSEIAKKLTEAYNVDRVLELQGDGQTAAPTNSNKCGQCLQPAEKKCSNCELVFYCSRQCQVKHWPAHKTFCKWGGTKKNSVE